MNTHRIVRWENGQASIADSEGRAMHSRIGPEAEARAVYLEPSQLLERTQHAAAEPLLILDVGMGLATNALAALEALNSTPTAARRPVVIESFESTLDGIALALQSTDDPAFQWLKPHEAKLKILLQNGSWEDPARRLRWILHTGDFREHLPQLGEESAELIFFDFYAPKTCPELWSPELFSALRRKVSPERGLLLTYSSATPVRAALLLAGWFVGAGAKTAAKLDTTLASPCPRGLPSGSLLGEAWKRKLETSTQVAPEVLLASARTPEHRLAIDSQIRETLRRHPQWVGSTQDSIG